MGSSLMMIFISLVLSSLLWNQKEIFYYYGGLICSLSTLFYMNNFSGLYLTVVAFMDPLAFWLIALTVIISSASWMAASFFYKFQISQSSLFWLLNMILIFTFLSKTPLIFYFWFEISLIPIFLVILGWGYQPERLAAGKSMFLYTIIGSLPLLVLILMIYFLTDMNLFLFWNFSTNLSNMKFISNIITLGLVFSFLIKFPMYSVHLWLPKAHVEAPVSGSMILAGVLLKLGGFGIYRISYSFSSHSMMANFIAMFSLMGGAWISLICISQNDMKVLIAYSSVSHMSLAISTILMKSSLSALSGKLMLICHGWSSAAMFFGINTLYLRAQSRSINMTKGLLNLLPAFTIFWAISSASNMACPPSLNLFSEMLVFMSMMSNNLVSSFPLIIMGFIAAAYSLILYSSMIHGKPSSSMKYTHPILLQERWINYIFIMINFSMFAFIMPLI